MKTVMIVAGESSGELYGSLLAKALRTAWPEVRVTGIGGERMRDAGVELLAGISSSFGVTETLLSFRRLRESFNIASKALTEMSPDVVVPIDYPDFNFRIARLAKRHGTKVLYYVSPQVWAWRKGRVKTMGEIADRVAAILPFEEEIYNNAGVGCEFVGHPAMEEIEGYEKELLNPANLSEKGPIIALLPGSRPHELKTLLPVFAEFVRAFKNEWPDWRFVLPLAPNMELDSFSGQVELLRRLDVGLVEGETVKTLASARMAVVASGTATLQAAFLGVPMVVVYKLSPITYFLGRNVLDIKYISLVNIIPGRQVVRELIQHEATVKNIMQETRKILYDDSYRSSMMSSFQTLRKTFEGRRPSQRVAEIAGELAGWDPGRTRADS